MHAGPEKGFKKIYIHKQTIQRQLYRSYKLHIKEEISHRAYMGETSTDTYWTRGKGTDQENFCDTIFVTRSMLPVTFYFAISEDRSGLVPMGGYGASTKGGTSSLFKVRSMTTKTSDNVFDHT